eukprot:m.255467 g.255467  ORF g.255467 m.255467 type:complete len:644 (+) comp16180_c0_seq1:171-2102(+)
MSPTLPVFDEKKRKKKTERNYCHCKRCLIFYYGCMSVLFICLCFVLSIASRPRKHHYEYDGGWERQNGSFLKDDGAQGNCWFTQGKTRRVVKVYIYDLNEISKRAGGLGFYDSTSTPLVNKLVTILKSNNFTDGEIENIYEYKPNVFTVKYKNGLNQEVSERMQFEMFWINIMQLIFHQVEQHRQHAHEDEKIRNRAWERKCQGNVGFELEFHIENITSITGELPTIGTGLDPEDIDLFLVPGLVHYEFKKQGVNSRVKLTPAESVAREKWLRFFRETDDFSTILPFMKTPMLAKRHVIFSSLGKYGNVGGYFNEVGWWCAPFKDDKMKLVQRVSLGTTNTILLPDSSFDRTFARNNDKEALKMRSKVTNVMNYFGETFTYIRNKYATHGFFLDSIVPNCIGLPKLNLLINSSFTVTKGTIKEYKHGSSIFGLFGAHGRHKNLRQFLTDKFNLSYASANLVDTKLTGPADASMLHATFCLMPEGDWPERNGMIQSVRDICIPVFFSYDSIKLHLGYLGLLDILYDKEAMEQAFYQDVLGKDSKFKRHYMYIDKKPVLKEQVDLKTFLESLSTNAIAEKQDFMMSIRKRLLFSKRDFKIDSEANHISTDCYNRFGESDENVSPVTMILQRLLHRSREICRIYND